MQDHFIPFPKTKLGWNLQVENMPSVTTNITEGASELLDAGADCPVQVESLRFEVILSFFLPVIYLPV